MVWDILPDTYLAKRLHDRSRHSPVVVGDVRGKGLMRALELVSDRARKTAAPKDVVQRVQDVAYEAGVMIRTSGSNVIISPPLVITAADVDRILAALDAALTAGEG
jgi:putrescine aminotransferase